MSIQLEIVEAKALSLAAVSARGVVHIIDRHLRLLCPSIATGATGRSGIAIS